LSRLPQTLIVLALLVATATAFAVTERLKLEKSPVTGTQVDKIFSPVCECPHDVAVISFRLRKPETVTVDVLDSHGNSVATLVRNQHEQTGRVSYTWDGRNDLGLVVGEGRYRPRVRLRAHGRTIVLPNPIRVDTTPPTIKLVRTFPKVLSPGIAGRHDRLTALYQSNERARAMMLVDGQRRVLSRFRATKGRLRWFGLVNGRAVPPGTYKMQLRAFDQAGNRSSSTPAVEVRVQYIGFRRNRITADAGKRFSVRVSTFAPAYRWVFNRRRGSTRKKVLVLRAPTRAGTFPLYVRVGEHAARAVVVVRNARS
jgi:flagellar hook assembly protein FlgD